MDTVVIDANALASWLARDAADSWWTVDGESVLESELALPVSGSDLAEAVRKHGGEVVFFVPHHGSTTWTGDIGAFAGRDSSGARVFQLAWKSQPDRPWVVAEDVEAARIAAG